MGSRRGLAHAAPTASGQRGGPALRALRRSGDLGGGDRPVCDPAGRHRRRHGRAAADRLARRSAARRFLPAAGPARGGPARSHRRRGLPRRRGGSAADPDRRADRHRARQPGADGHAPELAAGSGPGCRSGRGGVATGGPGRDPLGAAGRAGRAGAQRRPAPPAGRLGVAGTVRLRRGVAHAVPPGGSVRPVGPGRRRRAPARRRGAQPAGSRPTAAGHHAAAGTAGGPVAQRLPWLPRRRIVLRRPGRATDRPHPGDPADPDRPQADRRGDRRARRVVARPARARRGCAVRSAGTAGSLGAGTSGGGRRRVRGGTDHRPGGRRRGLPARGASAALASRSLCGGARRRAGGRPRRATAPRRRRALRSAPGYLCGRSRSGRPRGAGGFPRAPGGAVPGGFPGPEPRGGR